MFKSLGFKANSLIFPSLSSTISVFAYGEISSSPSWLFTINAFFKFKFLSASAKFLSNLGVDVIIESFTKYVSGHSDVMMGGVIARGKYYRRIKEQSELMGQCTSPDDVYLAMRGLRTIEVRLEKSFTSSIKIANWIAKIPCVKNVYHPATKHHPDYMIFKRDFNIGAGLFSFEIKQIEQSKIDKFIDSLELFGIGASWGGFESLVLPAEVKKIRRFDTFKNSALIRLAIGLENPDDLIDDLNRSFAKLD